MTEQTTVTDKAEVARIAEWRGDCASVLHLPTGERIVVGPGRWSREIARRRIERAAQSTHLKGADHDNAGGRWAERLGLDTPRANDKPGPREGDDVRSVRAVYPMGRTRDVP